MSIIIDEKGQYNKHILIDAYGYAKPGEITCIIGPSGSGKTSLLNILTQRSKVSRGSNFSGTITANSKQMQGEEFRKFGAYVPQDDHLMMTETPEELFTFATRLTSNYDNETIVARVNSIINRLGLE